jgi:3-deoxy-manno-octulosonate cytidylyltransferase (CMP-KDO synthetase)
MTQSKIIARQDAARFAGQLHNNKAKIVFTNGCFDILHAGHIELLEKARGLGDCLVVGVNSDASVKRLKGESRPVNPQDARARVLAALQCVDAVCIFEDDTPIPLLEDIRPGIHVKGGDYLVEDLPEAATIKKHGGEVVIIPFVAGFSTTSTLEKLNSSKTQQPVVIIPARFGSTRFPGKPLAILDGKTVIARVVEAALETRAARPVLVATDDERIAAEIESQFSVEDAQAVMTSEACQTGTDRIAEVIRARFAEKLDERLIVVNVQGDEPFVNPQHLDELMQTMQERSTLRMATLGTPLKPEHTNDPNVVKLVRDLNGNALYFSRLPIPFNRDASEQGSTPRLHHLGVYAYEAKWLLEMAQLSPSPLEQLEKLEQLRALENGVDIGVVIAENVVPIAIDTPHDLAQAQEYLRAQANS